MVLSDVYNCCLREETIMALIIVMQYSLYICEARIPLDPRKRRNACHVKSRWNRFSGPSGPRYAQRGPVLLLKSLYLPLPDDPAGCSSKTRFSIAFVLDSSVSSTTYRIINDACNREDSFAIYTWTVSLAPLDFLTEGKRLSERFRSRVSLVTFPRDVEITLPRT